MAAHGFEADNDGYEIHPLSMTSVVLQELADGPKTADDLGCNPLDAPMRVRNYVRKLGFAGGGSGPMTVYYLHGDDRRAARRFVLDNREYVERELDKPNTGRLRTRLPDAIYRLVIEEAQLQYNDR